MEPSSFSLLSTVAALQRRWKTIAAFVVVCAVIAAVAVNIVPRYYRSVATVVPGNSSLADKGRLFNSNIKDLYSYFGNGDDLDRILGLANRQSAYMQLADEFSLIDYYGLKGNDRAVLRIKAARRLEKDLSVRKTEEGAIAFVLWTKDAQLSANIINRMIAIIGQTAQDIFKKNYSDQILQFDSSLAALQQEYTMLDNPQVAVRAQNGLIAKQQLLNRMQDFSRLAAEFRLAAKSLPAVLYVTEPAFPAAFAERPDKPAVIIAAALLALVFGCIVVLINDRKST